MDINGRFVDGPDGEPWTIKHRRATGSKTEHYLYNGEAEDYADRYVSSLFPVVKTEHYNLFLFDLIRGKGIKSWHRLVLTEHQAFIQPIHHPLNLVAIDDNVIDLNKVDRIETTIHINPNKHHVA
ncbi:MAG: hypothetical protein ACTSWQ_00855 [Candidatus Thorarchaeota archaeon]